MTITIPYAILYLRQRRYWQVIHPFDHIEKKSVVIFYREQLHDPGATMASIFFVA